MFTKIKKFLDSGLFKTLYACFGALNAYIALCISTDTYGNSFKTIFGKVGVWIIEFGGGFIFFTVLVASFYPIFYAWIEKHAENIQQKYEDLSKQYDITLKILEKIEKIVEQKRQRFADLAGKFKTTPQTPTPKTIFTQLTQPEKQMKIIMQSLEDCLKSIYPKEYIKVALMCVKDGKLDSWQCFLPYNARPRTDIVELRNPLSTISRCLNDKKIKIVADTQLELKKTDPNDMLYIQGNTGKDESWCQLCYPVISINTNEVIFIISLAIKRANVFNASGQEYLEWLLGFFESRLALEHSLKELKELTT